MVFAKRVFQLAGIWGFAVLLLGYAAVLFGGPAWSVTTDHPEHVHGFFLVTLAWQVAFFVIATDPVRFRPLMLAAAFAEKLPYALVTFVLFAQAQVGPMIPAFGLVDTLLAALFIAAYVRTGRQSVANS
jgi:hypothetical protein